MLIWETTPNAFGRGNNEVTDGVTEVSKAQVILKASLKRQLRTLCQAVSGPSGLKVLPPGKVVGWQLPTASLEKAILSQPCPVLGQLASVTGWPGAVKTQFFPGNTDNSEESSQLQNSLWNQLTPLWLGIVAQPPPHPPLTGAVAECPPVNLPQADRRLTVCFPGNPAAALA